LTDVGVLTLNYTTLGITEQFNEADLSFLLAESDRTYVRARLGDRLASVCCLLSVVCDVMYCG